MQVFKDHFNMIVPFPYLSKLVVQDHRKDLRTAFEQYVEEFDNSDQRNSTSMDFTTEFHSVHLAATHDVYGTVLLVKAEDVVDGTEFMTLKDGDVSCSSNQLGLVVPRSC